MNEYQEIFSELSSDLLKAEASGTGQLTKRIKEYFGRKYSQYYVAGTNGNREFLFDITVMTCNPLVVHENKEPEYKIYLAVESELGGESASSPKNVERNTVEDFFKLISADAERKVMVAAYSSLAGQEDNITLESRINKLSIINNKSNNVTDILVMFIKGSHKIGRSR